MTDTYACGIEMPRPEGDLFEILGLTDRSFGAVRDACAKVNLAEVSPDERYAWKALSDWNYYDVYRTKGTTKALFDAGFFDDGLPKFPGQYNAYDASFACTSTLKIQKLYQARDPNKPNAVLITTGGMAPIHNGHIDMMEEARRQVQEQGYNVIGGYFAPGHDSYVGKKYGGSAAIPASHRCAMVELAVQDSDWLELDPWAARYMPAEINFTDVVRRLTTYLAVDQPRSFIKVFYVCGSDNAGFEEACPDQTIVVDRTSLSSRMAREGNYEHLHPAVKDYLLNWQKPNDSPLPYLIRNEENESISGWSTFFDEGEMTRRRVQLQSAIRLGIAQLFKNNGENHKVHLLTVADQRIAAAKVINGRKVLTLDPFTQGSAYIHSTRYFSLAGAQFKPEFRAERPGYVKLANQVAMIDPGHYVMVEDDSVTGGTIRAIKALLPKEVVIDDVVLLSDFAHYSDETYYDVVDLRDFIVGSFCGGLSVLLTGGRKGRAPYVVPFVSLRSRAKIPAEAEIELSRVIWQANVRFFEGTGIKIRHADYGFQQLASDLGWAYSDTMEDFCRHYAGCLMEIIG